MTAPRTVIRQRLANTLLVTSGNHAKLLPTIPGHFPEQPCLLIGARAPDTRKLTFSRRDAAQVAVYLRATEAPRERMKNPADCRMLLSAVLCNSRGWALRDSNPRPPRCKRGALAN
jgi:hypothetical protein